MLQPVQRIGINEMTGAEMRELRRRLKMNQLSFWSKLGVTQSGGSRYEAGRDIPEPVKLLIQLVYGSEESSTALLAKLRQK